MISCILLVFCSIHQFQWNGHQTSLHVLTQYKEYNFNIMDLYPHWNYHISLISSYSKGEIVKYVVPKLQWYSPRWILLMLTSVFAYQSKSWIEAFVNSFSLDNSQQKTTNIWPKRIKELKKLRQQFCLQIQLDSDNVPGPF